MKSPEFNLYTKPQAEDEAQKMQEKIKAGEAKDYSDAERKIEAEREFESLKKEIRHPKVMDDLVNGPPSMNVRYVDSDGKEKPEVIQKKNYYASPASYPGMIMITGPDYETAGRLKGMVGKGANAITITGYNFEVALSLDYNRDEIGDDFPTREEADKDPEKANLVLKKYDEVFDIIRIEEGENSRRRDVREFLQEKLNGEADILDVLKEAESQGLLTIGHIPDYYTNDNALRSKYNLKFDTKKSLEEFLQSPYAKGVSPETILGRASDLDAETIMSLLDRYKDEVDLTKIPNLFGSESFVQNLEKKDKEAILDQVMSALEAKTEEAIRRNEERGIWVDWDDVAVQAKCSLIRTAAAQGIILPNYKERLLKLQSATNYYPSLHSGRVINNQREEISNTGLLIEKLLQNKDDISGKGLEFVNSDYGQGRKVYLDGELVGSFVGAEFSEKPTNGEVVAWVKRVVIDRNNVTGIQYKDTVSAFRKGRGVGEVYEKHAWTNEEDFKVYAPEVTEDGKIIVKVRIGDKIESREF